jgi:hypothetical protein
MGDSFPSSVLKEEALTSVLLYPAGSRRGVSENCMIFRHASSTRPHRRIQPLLVLGLHDRQQDRVLQW